MRGIHYQSLIWPHPLHIITQCLTGVVNSHNTIISYNYNESHQIPCSFFHVCLLFNMYIHLLIYLVKFHGYRILDNGYYQHVDNVDAIVRYSQPPLCHFYLHPFLPPSSSILFVYLFIYFLFINLLQTRTI